MITRSRCGGIFILCINQSIVSFISWCRLYTKTTTKKGDLPMDEDEMDELEEQIEEAGQDMARYAKEREEARQNEEAERRFQDQKLADALAQDQVTTLDLPADHAVVLHQHTNHPTGQKLYDLLTNHAYSSDQLNDEEITLLSDHILDHLSFTQQNGLHPIDAIIPVFHPEEREPGIRNIQADADPLPKIATRVGQTLAVQLYLPEPDDAQQTGWSLTLPTGLKHVLVLDTIDHYYADPTALLTQLRAGGVKQVDYLALVDSDSVPDDELDLPLPWD